MLSDCILSYLHNVLSEVTVMGTIYGIRLIGGPDANLIEENTVTGSGTFDLFHDAASTLNTWNGNTCGTKSGADIPDC